MATAIGIPVCDLKKVSHKRWNGVHVTQECVRCGGFMVIDQCFDLQSDNGNFDFQASRCVQCGELVDPIILQNRLRQSLGIVERIRKVQQRRIFIMDE